MTHELQEQILAAYNRTESIKSTAKLTGCTEGTVRKTLISAGILRYPRTEQIEALSAHGMTEDEIAETLHISKSTVNAYRRYKRYRPPEKTENALRIEKCRKKKKQADG